MKKFRLVLSFVLFEVLILIGKNECKMAEERLCADERCSVTISQVKTLLRYSSPDKDRISFERGVIADVLSKARNSWLIRIGNREGYAPASFLREVKVFFDRDSLINPEAQDPELSSANAAEARDDDLLDKVQLPISSSILSFPSVASAEPTDTQQGSETSPPSPQFEVVDGTTLFLDPVATISETQPSVAPFVSGESSKGAPETLPEVSSTSVEKSTDAAEAQSTQQSSAEVSLAPAEKSTEAPEAQSEEQYFGEDGSPTFTETTEAPIEDQSVNLVEKSADLDTSQNEQEPIIEPHSSSDTTSEVTQQVEDQNEATTEFVAQVMKQTEETLESLPQTKDQVETMSEVGHSTSESEVQDATQQGEGVLSNIWNSVFSSGDGTEEKGEELEEEEEVDDDEEDEEEEDRSEESAAGQSDGDRPKENEDNSLRIEEPTAEEPSGTEPLADLPLQSSSETGSVTESPSSDISQPPPAPPVFSMTPGFWPSSEPQPPEAPLPEAHHPEAPLSEPPLPAHLSYEAPPSQPVELEKIRVPRQVEVTSGEELGGVYPPQHFPGEVDQKSSEVIKEAFFPDAKPNLEEQEQSAEEVLNEQPRAAMEMIGGNEEVPKSREEVHWEQQEQVKPLEKADVSESSKEELVETQQPKEATPQYVPQYVPQSYAPATEQPTEQLIQPSVDVIEQSQEQSNQTQEPVTEQPTGQYTEQPMETGEQPTEQTGEQLQEEQVAGSMLSWFSGLFASQQTQGSDEEAVVEQTADPVDSLPPPPAPSPPPYYHEHSPAWGSIEQSSCSSPTECQIEKEVATEDSEGHSLFFGLEKLSLDGLLLRFGATVMTLLLGVLTFYFVQKKHVDSVLVARINELEKQLLVASKEALMLSEEVSSATAQMDSREQDLLREELESCRAARADLEEQVATLERELEEATETGIELNNLLAQTLEASKGKAHAGLMASVKRLQDQLDAQRDKVDSLTRSLAATSAENATLKSSTSESLEKVAALEAELAAAAEVAVNLRREREEAEVEAAQKMTAVQTRLEEALSSKVLQESRLASELSALKLGHEKLRAALAARDAEVQALQDVVKESESGGDRADQLLDFAKLRAEVEQTKSDRDSCREELAKEEAARKRLEAHAELINGELSKLRSSFEEAQKERLEAETRLSVLSNYFKEKEAQLLKELSLQEAIVAQHRGDESSVVKHLQSLQEEVETYRAQNQSLKNEILDQERDFKAQMASLEKKAHDNWMTARQAERRLEESRQEAAQLRNRLTLVEKNNADQNSRIDTNGEGGIASPVMMVPLPPLGDMETPPPLPPFMFSPPPYPPPFMPPPPHPHPMGRPPPLGRMSSPPPPPLGQFSPPPPPYDRLDRSSRSPSPPPHRYHHRSPPPPQQWEESRASFRPVPKPSPKKPHEQRDHKGSALSSGHSNESLEKSRHSEHSREHV